MPLIGLHWRRKIRPHDCYSLLLAPCYMLPVNAMSDFRFYCLPVKSYTDQHHPTWRTLIQMFIRFELTFKCLLLILLCMSISTPHSALLLKVSSVIISFCGPWLGVVCRPVKPFGTVSVIMGNTNIIDLSWLSLLLRLYFLSGSRPSAPCWNTAQPGDHNPRPSLAHQKT